MAEHKKLLKKTGTVLILLGVIIFVLCNVRFRPAGTVQSEQETTVFSTTIEEIKSNPAVNSSQNPADAEEKTIGSDSRTQDHQNHDTEEAGNQTGGKKEQDTPVTGEGSTQGGQAVDEAGTQSAQDLKEYITCFIEIRCDSAVAKKPQIQNPGILECIPDDGTILAKTAFQVVQGTTVYEVLRTAAAQHQIAVVANAKGTYVSSINNLSEKMVGQGSGWTYRVNGEMVMRPASGCIVKQGDAIQWIYVTG